MANDATGQSNVDATHVSVRGGVAAGASASGAVAVGALAVGALAVGALAVGALAVGALAIKKLEVVEGRLDDLYIEKLTIGELVVLAKDDETS
jgi:hypothetical protein